MTPPDIYGRHQISPSGGGYFRYPTFHGNRVVFVSEDDLWTVPLDGGVARRLTATRGSMSHPVFSPDGDYIAYTSTEQGCPEVFVMPAAGGEARQLTFSGGHDTEVFGWSRDGECVLFRSNRSEPFAKRLSLHEVPFQGGQWRRKEIGSGYGLAFESDGPGRVLVRHTDDLAWWKRYRGGTAGQLWIDTDGDDSWQRLLPDVTAGMCRPMWIDGRIYFITDEEGTGNIHSCTPDGDDVRRHTSHEGHYARFASHHDTTVVYVRAGQLYRLDIATDGGPQRIDVDYPSPRPHLKPKYVDAEEYLEDFALHPEGHSLAVGARGKTFNFGNWEGGVRQTGRRHGVRYRLARYLDGERLLVVSDESGEERVEVHSTAGGDVQVVDTGDFDIGSPVDVAVSPEGDQVLLTNHRHEVVYLHLDDGTRRIVDDSSIDSIAGIAWAPDNRHVAYAVQNSFHTSIVKICDVAGETTAVVTEGEFRDINPVFDPQGRYLYFLSYRQFTPAVEQIYRDLSFPQAGKPCVVTLREDVDSPFRQTPKPLDDDSSNGDGPNDDTGFAIDFDGLRDRVELFPVSGGNYDAIAATKDRVFWTVFPPRTEFDFDEDRRGKLQYYDLNKQKVEGFAKDVSTFTLDRSRKTLALNGKEGLRVVGASSDGVDTKKGDSRPGRASGLVDLNRIRVAVDPRAEWCQMLREAWRQMRDNFWRADMSGVDWDEIWDRYKQVLPRVSTRGEFADLVWMMQGELGTSHAYIWGGDFETPPQYQPGLLGADLRWEKLDGGRGALRVDRILRGDPWDTKCQSPLMRPGVGVGEGDAIVSINGQPVTEQIAAGELLACQAGREVELGIFDSNTDTEDATRTVTVKTLRDERPLRYRDWVRMNRSVVHDATDGKLGYVHVPDMGLDGFAEFHRQFLVEHRRDALLVDVRYNGGGFVSALLLEKLARQPVGFSVSRHGPLAHPYPAEVVRGPMVALTNARAGSDGDIFSHCFKELELGPLLGERTWGGTIGIRPRRPLADGSYTTQPEFAFWFEDVGFGLENRGAVPDIEVPFPPTSKDGPTDPQLLRAIEVAMEALEEAVILEPPEKDTPNNTESL